ncbi:MAG: type VI secretion system protein TssA [Candidatus Competibacteraceae bacterium]
MNMLDVEKLLGEIAADAPCGEDLEYDPKFADMEKLARETPERQFGGTIIPAEPPDWRGVGKAALTLLERTRDLRVAVNLTRSLLHTEGLSGFAAGLALVDGLIERFWETIYPQLDPDDNNDPTLRVNTIVALCDPETTLRALREMPLVSSRTLGRFSLRDIHIVTGVLTPVAAKEPAEPPTQAKIDGAFQEVDLEELKMTAGAANEAVDRAMQIEALLTDRVGVTQAPDMSALTGVLKEIRQVLTEHLRRRGVNLVEEAAAEAGERADSGSAGSAGAVQRLVVGEIANREDALRMIDKVCEYFNRYEPSSPVPFLLKRARSLASKDFMEILQDIAPGGTSQADLIFGSQGKDAASP